MVKKLFILFAPVLILACTISTNVTPPAPVVSHKGARDVVITPAPVMKPMQPVRWQR